MTTDQIIKAFIKENASKDVISIAEDLYPEFENANEDLIYFTSENYNEEELYDIEISTVNNKIITNCTCYDFIDNNHICEHIVAALDLIIYDPDVYENKYVVKFLNQISKTNPVKDDSNTFSSKIKNIINLQDNVITKEVLSNFNRYSYHNYQIQSINLPEIKTEVKGWSNNMQTFTHVPEKSILEYNCDCIEMKKPCEHIGYALKEIVKVYGPMVFTKNYFETKKIEFALKNGFSLEDKYEDIFNFELTNKGFEAKSKYKNILNQSLDLTNVFEDEATEQILNLPYENKNELYTVGLIFKFYKKQFAEIYSFEGKLNKSKNDIASSIVKIDSYNILDFISQYTKEDQQILLTKTPLLNIFLEKLKSNVNLVYVKKGISVLKELIPVWQKNFIFKYQDSNSLVRKNIEPFQIIEKPINLVFKFTEDELFYTLKAKVVIDGKEYNLNSSEFSIETFFIIFKEYAIPVLDSKIVVYLKTFSNKSEVNYYKKNVPDFIEKVLIPLSSKFEVQSTIFKKNKQVFEGEILEKQVYMKDFEGEYITFKLAVQYPNQLIDVFSSDILFDKDNDKKLNYSERNQAFEDNFIEEFVALHPEFENQSGLFYLTPEQLFNNHWMLTATENMKQKGIKVFGANDLKSFKFNLNKPVISVNLKSDIDWFDIEIEVSFGNQKVSLKDIQKSIIKKTNYVTLGDGTIGILAEEWINKFENYFKTGEIKKNSIQISNYQFGIIDELYEEMENKPTFLQELYDKKKRLQNITEIEEIAIPKGIKAKLRDYQHHGLNWMAFLHKNQLGGCLADDMGLGKTLQTIAFLQYLKNTTKSKVPSLIIAPTSLIFNWMAEIEKFCPTLKIQPFVGASRATNTDSFNKFDLIISTYGSLLNDVEFLKDFKFNYIILDESQAIKNPNSKRYKAVRLLNSFNRLVLTGTPIENNTFDLYAQLNFLNPGLLGNMTHFKTNFSDAIDKEKDVDSSILLSKIIAPFILRRTKEQVAKELPDKTESIIYCDMSKEQRNVYEAFKNKYKDYLLNKIDENGVAKSQMYILEGLTKLRQICNSTELINEDADYGNYSAKLEILLENIKEKTGNHKILVFSQFVKMLQIVKNKLDEEKISYEYLDGQTKNRQENVNNFQENKDVRVFLISLKAGGTGLNLTEADYVFIIDPWWNPAVENQAIDRCYRIGQTKQVMAYRMICRDTIEEKIVKLQSKKKAVASSIISIDEEKKSFDIDEVKELFS